MGGHAGEDARDIFERKMADIEAVGQTFWVAKSSKVRPAQVQEMCSAAQGFVVFVEPASLGGARPTTESASAVEYSSDGLSWLPLPRGITPVTGQIDAAAAALIFDQLTTHVEGVIDLWAYADQSDSGEPLKFILGRSTACAIRKDTSLHPRRMKSRYRSVVAVARLAEPYCTWLR
jgi:hypothetical protein